MRRLLVTGAGGFVGARVVRRALVDGWQVVAVGRTPGPQRLAGLGPGVEFRVADLCEPAALTAIAAEEGPEVIVHAAAPGVVRGGQESAAALGEACERAGVEVAAAATTCGAGVVWVGSCFEYGSSEAILTEQAPLAPASAYGAAKVRGREAFLVAAGGRLRHLTLRLFHVYGPGEPPQRLVPSALLAPMGRAENWFGDPACTRDFVFVDDVADAILRASQAVQAGRPPTPEVLNVASGVGVTIGTLTELAAAVSGHPEFAYRFRGSPPLRGFDPPTLVGSGALAERVIGWRAVTDLESGLRASLRAVLGQEPGS